MNNRIYYLDTMRGILMILILVLHSAQVFNPRQEWVIYSQKTTPLAAIFVDVIALLSLPAFFIVSGYFAIATLRKDGNIKFFKVRIVMRLLIPTLTTALTLNSLQMYLLVKSGWKDFHLFEYIIYGGWKMHLWFLINLIVYFSLIFIFSKVFITKKHPLLEYMTKVFLKVPFFVLLVCLPLVVIGFLAFGKIYPIKGIIDSSAILLYFPFFLFGVLLRNNEILMKRFVEFPFLYSLIISLISLFLVKYLNNNTGFVWFVIKFYFAVLAMWSLSSMCFHIFKKLTNYDSKFFAFLSSASYTVYLFHHVLVIAVGLLFIHYGIGGMFGMFLLIFIVGTVSLLIHLLLISKINILSILFNGKALKKQ